MAKRGRKSAAEISAEREIARLRPTVVEKPNPPPKPPETLNEKQAGVWTEVASKLPPNWIKAEHVELFSQFCRHTVSAQRIGELVEKIVIKDDEDLRVYDRLLKIRERETRALLAIARSLRLTHQSQESPERARSKLKPRPVAKF